MNIKFIHIPKKICERGKLVQYQVMIPSVGMWGLANLARAMGNDVEIIHTGIEETLDPEFNLETYLEKEKTDVVCVALHWHLQLHEVFETTKNIRERCPRVKIIIGGLTASYFYDSIMKEWPQIDVIIKGDAEKPLRALIHSGFRNLLRVPNVVWRDKNGNVNDNAITYCGSVDDIEEFSKIELKLLKNYEYYSGTYYLDVDRNVLTTHEKRWYLNVGRGCSANCIYCGGGKEAFKVSSNRTNIALRSPEAVLQDMITLKNEFKFTDYYICFHPPSMKNSYYIKLFAMVRREMKTSMIFEYYNNLMDDNFIRIYSKMFMMERSRIDFSPTVFSENLRKYITPSAFRDSELEEIVKLMHNLGLKTCFYYSLFPQEKRESMLQGASVARRLIEKYPNLTVIIMPIDIEPFSPWFADPDKYGIHLTRSTLLEFQNHHSRRRGLDKEEDLGYRFPGYENVLDTIGNYSDNPRWCCFSKNIYNSFF